MTRRRELLALGLMAGAGGLARAEPAADFPSRSIRIVVPFTPGSGSDSSSRFFAEKLAPLLGQSVIVDNRPGGNGIIGFMATKTAPADGYTLVLASNSPICVNPLTVKNLPYHPIRDFRPLAGLGRGMNVLVVANESPFRTLAELIATAKAGDRPLSAGTYSQGYQLALEWLASQAGVKFTNVPYKGQAPIMTDVIGRQLDLALVDMGGAASLLAGGRLRALAVSGETRHVDFPDLPTVKESYPAYVTYSWTSLQVRAQTPDDIVAKLGAAIMAVHATPEAKAFARRNGTEMMPLDATQMAAFQRSEIERFRGIAQRAGIEPE